MASADIIEQLQGEQVRRLRSIRAINRLDNAAAALVRRELGWRYDTPEADRGKINARAKGLVSALYDGKPVKEADQRITALVAGEVELYRLARTPLITFRNETEKTMRKLARQLPAWPWVESVRGFGDLAFAVMVAEAGDLAKYPGTAQLWKRFGLTPYQGKAASTWRRKGGLTADEWQAYGYRPSRNAESYAVLGDPLFKQQTMVGGVYRAVYDREKARFLAREETKMHAHMHGLRCMRKAALEDLWRVWQGRPPKERPLVDHSPCISDDLSEAIDEDAPLPDHNVLIEETEQSVSGSDLAA
jgi:hypothetical protein